jgi:hypothetical protein
MQDLDRALAEITAIRSQMARGAEFRGYGPITVAATGVLALMAAALQALLIADPSQEIFAYLTLWITAAFVSTLLVGIEMIWRSRRLHRGFADEMIYAAIEKFMPACVAGMLVTVVLSHFAPQSLSLLPGLWQIVFSLGIFASCHSLPHPTFAAGVWYLLAGLVNLALPGEGHAFSPWSMGVPFGVGQMLVAAILLGSLGEHDAQG